jgi:hypothetical protein
MTCCARVAPRFWHVEVKGTTGEGNEVLLTPNEVEHAHVQYPHVALVVVSHISLTDEPEPVASGGRLQAVDPWKLDADQLEPIGYSYTVPTQS